MGWIGDTMGTKKALEISIALMLFPSLLIGCIPAYSIGGLVSTVILIILRLIQGLAVGGELVGAFIFTIEATGGKSRGFWGGACESCAGLGVTLGMGVVAILRAVTTKEQLNQWGWRSPFLGSVLFGIIGIWLRSQLEDEVEIITGDTKYLEKDNLETDNSLEIILQSESQQQVIDRLEKEIDDECRCATTPLAVTLLDNYRELLLVIFVSAFWGVSYYTNFVWIAYFLGTSLIGGDGISNAWLITFFVNCVLVVALPIGGILGDYIGQILSNEEKGKRQSFVNC
jgi:MHS family proline/betaine transporter-like MFS transporter